MSLLNIQFAQEEIKESLKDDFAPIPAGTYTAEITRSEVKENKSGSGNRLSLGFKILEGNHAGRLVFQDITLRNINDISQQIGRKKMAQLFHACGTNGVQDSSELHGIPMQIKVAIRKDKTGQYDDQNEIKKFAPLGGSKPSISQSFANPSYQGQGQGQGQGQPPQATQPAQANVPPWQRA